MTSSNSDRDIGNELVISENPKGSLIILDVTALILAIIFNVGLIAAVKKVALRIKGYRVFLINLAVANIFIATVSLLMYGTEYLSHYLQSKFVERCVGSVLRSLRYQNFTKRFQQGSPKGGSSQVSNQTTRLYCH